MDAAFLGIRIARRLKETTFCQAGRLVAVYPTHAQPITQKQAEMASRWETMQVSITFPQLYATHAVHTLLQDTAAARKECLHDSFNFFKFVADARELLAWHSRMIDGMHAMEPASDVPGRAKLVVLDKGHKLAVLCERIQAYSVRG